MTPGDAQAVEEAITAAIEELVRFLQVDAGLARDVMTEGVRRRVGDAVATVLKHRPVMAS